MKSTSRRELLLQQGPGLALLTGAGLVLRADAQPTPGARNPDTGARPVRGPSGGTTLRLPDAAKPTGATGFGPFYNPGAPFRGKSCPPFEPGTRLVVSGRVWAFDTKKPLSSAVIDVWHSDIQGNYSTGSEFRNRARVITAEEGQYEFEAIHPVAYPVNNGEWYRSPHIHFKIASAGYMTLVTELYFDGDKLHEQDKVFQPALMMPVHTRKAGEHAFETVVFDIVLEPGKGTKGA